MRTRKPLAVAAAIVGLAAPVQAEYYPGSTDLEGGDPLAGDLWSNVGEAEVVVDASVAAVPRSANLPPSFDATSRTNVLSVDTDETVVRHLQSSQAAPADSTIYADVLVKGCPMPYDAASPQTNSTDKILVYTRINQSGDATNLCVYAKDGNGTAQEFVLTKTVGGDEWHRLVIKATAEGYQIYCDGTDAADLCQTAGGVNTFYALTDGDPMTSLGFTGTGYVDDLVLSSFDPALPVYTLAWGEGFDTVSFTTNGITGEALAAADGEYQFQAPEGLAVVLTGDTGYRTIEVSGTGTSSAISLPGVSGIAKYFPQSATAGQDGTAANPYEIPDIDALNALKGAVLETNCANLCFVQTANIDMASAGAWAGIGEYAANLNNGLAFSGTYDGQGCKISNVDFTQRNYGGVFNQVKGGTIQNLVVENITCNTFDSSVNGGEWGCAIVGNAGMGATLRNLEARGDFGTAAIPCSHNVAGIAIRVCGGASNVVDGVVMLETLVKDCTNNAALHGTYTKLGGMSALTQDLNGVPNDYVLYDGCVNNGTLTATANANGKNPGVDGIAGIVGYVGDATQLKDCVNNGTYSSVYGSAKTAELVAYQTSKKLTDLGGNKGDAAKNFVHTQSAANLIGFKYATVDDGVATTIAPPYTLAAGNTYLLESDVAASETPVATLTTAGSTIAFDTALGYTFAGTVAADEPFVVTSSTSGTVTTYTAETQGYYDPQGTEIMDYAVLEWLSNNGFTQAEINALGNDSAATDRLYECYLFNLDFTVPDADAAISFTDITVSNRVSMTVQLVRKAPLAGRINGMLYLYGANDLATGFGNRPIPDESVEYFTGDPSFNLATSTDDTVTQTAVATLNNSVTAKFFKATIEVPWVDNGEEFEPEDPGEPEEP